MPLSLSLEISQQIGEGGFEGVVVFPVGEVGDVIFPDFGGQIFAGVGVEAGPVLDLLEAAEADGKQLLSFLAELGLTSPADLGHHPFAAHALLRQHQQQTVVDLNGLINLLHELLASLHIFGSKPDSQLFGPHSLMQPPSELVILAAVADEARLVLHRLHCPDERRQVGDQILWHTTAMEELLGDSSLGLVERVHTDCAWTEMVD